MVSLHTVIEFENSSKKRKWDDPEERQVLKKKFKHPENEKSICDIDLHLETPLPLDWQRCLDIKSGHVYFHNTRTKERTSRDPRKCLEERSSDHPSRHMSLDLELNLPYESLSTNQCNHHQNKEDKKKHNKSSNDDDKRLTDTRSWLTFDEEDDQQEMVAAVCKKCFMLVMLFKSSPTCPNCKFMNPQQEHSPSTTLNLFTKKRLSQLLY